LLTLVTILITHKFIVNYLSTLKSKLFAEITAVPVVLQNSYYPALNGLRGVSILMVILTHFGLNDYTFPYHISIDSHAGVHIFFVMSGYLITILLLKEKLKYGNINLKYFYIRRTLRILPVVCLFLVVLAILNYIFKLHIATMDFVTSILFVKNLPVAGSYYTAHFWSLAVEEQFYLVFPIILMLSTNKYMVLALSIVIGVPLIAILGFYHVPFLCNNHFGILLRKLCMYAFWKGPVIILIGSVFSILQFKKVIRLDNVKVNYFLSFALLLIALIIRVPDFIFYTKYLCEYLSNLLIGIVIMLCISNKGLLSAVLNNAILLRIGILSYSLYIWQQLFVGNNAWQPWMHSFNAYPEWALIIIKLLFVFIIANLSYYFERRFLRIKNKYEPRSGTV
jgi:peptidoglycan/LPS O-acetylase OafA/YrhL